MLLIIFSIVFLVVGIVLMKCSRTVGQEFLGLIFTTVFGLVFAFSILMIFGVQTTKDLEYQKVIYEKEVLEYRIENINQDIVGNELIYNDVVEFNNELRGVKKWANNPWTSWFNNSKVAAIDYIDLNLKDQH